MARGKSKKKVSLGTSGSQSRWVVAREESKKKANPFEKSKAVEKVNNKNILLLVLLFQLVKILLFPFDLSNP